MTRFEHIYADADVRSPFDRSVLFYFCQFSEWCSFLSRWINVSFVDVLYAIFFTIFSSVLLLLLFLMYSSRKISYNANFDCQNRYILCYVCPFTQILFTLNHLKTNFPLFYHFALVVECGFQHRVHYDGNNESFSILNV